MGESALNLLRREHVAAILKVHPSTVDRMVKRGELPVVRWRQTVRFRESDINEFVERHLKPGGTR